VLRYPFKKGGFYLAILSGAPIVPIAIIGAREILPKEEMIVKPGNIKLVIGEPIYPNGHCIESLMEKTFITISDCLSESSAFQYESVTRRGHFT
jgi:1-acyl-sn-glycerol-3-phosphate acyltransferase